MSDARKQHGFRDIVTRKEDGKAIEAVVEEGTDAEHDVVKNVVDEASCRV